MRRCASCERELDASWKFCLYCGRPLVLVPNGVVDNIPAAIRSNVDQAVPVRRRPTTLGWVGIVVGVVGLVFLIYFAAQVFGPQS